MVPDMTQTQMSAEEYAHDFLRSIESLAGPRVHDGNLVMRELTFKKKTSAKSVLNTECTNI
jgi:hypothetical protein